MDAFSWLGDIADALLKFFPRLVIMRTTHEGVKWVCGRNVKLMTCQNGLFKTGLHFYLPLITETLMVPIKRQTTTFDTKAQYLITSDGQTVGVAGLLVYDVIDTIALLTETYEHDETIRDFGLTAVREVICSNTYEFLRVHHKDVDSQLRKKLSGELKRFGVRTVRVTLTNLSPAFVIGTWGSPSHGPQET